MRRRHSRSGSMRGEGGTDWSQQSLLPASMRSKPKPLPETMPPVEVDPVQEDAPEQEKVETMAVHADLAERFNQVMEV